MRLFAASILTLFLAVGTAIGRSEPSPTPVASGSPVATATDRIDTMLRTGHADAAWFSNSFLDQVPVSKIDEIIASLTASLGTYQRLEYTPTRFIAHFSKGTDDILIHLDTDNKIDGLLFKPPAVKTSSLDDALKELQPAEGRLSYIITEEGRSPRAALNASEDLAVGSAFKLAVFNALLDEIRSGKCRWNDVVPLNERWKSEPSGQLQRWPSATPITIASYAGQMISISDNTAADALIHIIKAKELALYQGQNDPFLTTREMFILKSGEGRALSRAYLAAPSAQARSIVVARVNALPLPEPADLITTPEVTIEWHYSVADLCKMIERVADQPVMSINPGVADPTLFRHVAYKGGSDFGVLNLTTMVTTNRGTKMCFSATVNDTKNGIAEGAFELKYAAVLRSLATL